MLHQDQCCVGKDSDTEAPHAELVIISLYSIWFTAKTMSPIVPMRIHEKDLTSQGASLQLASIKVSVGVFPCRSMCPSVK